MNLGGKSTSKLLMTLATSTLAAVGTAAGTTMWQSFGKPKMEQLVEKQKPKRKIGFIADWGRSS